MDNKVELFETRVVFKKIGDDVIAFLLDVDATYGMVMSYMHVGQHGEASIEFAKELENATEEEYADLRNELENFGYRLYLRERIHFRRR